MSVRPDWVEAVRQIGIALASGAEPEPEKVRSLLGQAVEMAAECTLEEIQVLQGHLDALRVIGELRKDAIQEELKDLTQKREAIRAYGSIEEHHKGQRLFKRA